MTAIPKVAGSIAHSLRSRLFGKLEQPSQPAPAAPAEELNHADGDLPETYGRDRLVMLVVDACQVHTYWEVTPQKLAEARETLGSDSPPAFLRFHEASDGGPQGLQADSFDVAVDIPSRNWYVHLWSPDKAYYAELGLKGDTGQFVSLAKSNVVRTPRLWPVMQVEERFMEVDAAKPQPEYVPPPAFVRPARERIFERPGQPAVRTSVGDPSAGDPPAAAPQASTTRPPTRINAEAILKEKLAELLSTRPAPRGGLQSQEVLPLTEPEIDLACLAEHRLIMGIFSRAATKTTE